MNRLPLSQLRAEVELVNRLYGGGPRQGGRTIEQVADELGRSEGWTWRRLAWDREMKAIGYSKRLPLHGRHWDHADFECRVAAFEKIRPTIEAREFLKDVDIVLYPWRKSSKQRLAARGELFCRGRVSVT